MSFQDMFWRAGDHRLDVISADEDEHSLGGLWEFVSTNTRVGALTVAEVDRAIEFGLPSAFTSQFELPLPEGLRL